VCTTRDMLAGRMPRLRIWLLELGGNIRGTGIVLWWCLLSGGLEGVIDEKVREEYPQSPHSSIHKRQAALLV
jgi:hypothetical protein